MPTKLSPSPVLGSADHHSILLAPTYSPVVKTAKKIIRDIKEWILNN